MEETNQEKPKSRKILRRGLVSLLAGSILAGTQFGRGEDFPPFYVKKQGTSYGISIGAYVELDENAKFYGPVIAGYCRNSGTINGAVVGGIAVGNTGNINGAVGGLVVDNPGTITGAVGGLGVNNPGTINGAVGGLGVGNAGTINGAVVGGLGVNNPGTITGAVGGIVVDNPGIDENGNKVYGKCNGLEVGVIFNLAEVAPSDRLVQLGLYNSATRDDKTTRGLFFNYIGRKEIKE